MSYCKFCPIFFSKAILKSRVPYTVYGFILIVFTDVKGILGGIELCQDVWLGVIVNH